MTTGAHLDAALSSFRRRLALWTAARGAALCALGALALSALLIRLGSHWEVVADAWRPLSAALYGGLAVALVAGLAWPLLRLSRRRAARVLEARTPALEGRVQTYLDRSAPGQPHSPLLELLADDARSVLERFPPASALPGRQIAFGLFAALLGGGAILWGSLYGPPGWQSAARRLWTFGMGGPVPRWVIEPGDVRALAGSEVEVRARAEGFEPARAQVRAWFGASPHAETVAMDSAGPGEFSFRFAGLRESLRYQIDAAGVQSGEFKVELIAVPELERSRLRVSFPEWAHREPIEQDPAGDIEALPGSAIELEVEADGPLGEAVVVVNGIEHPLQAEGARGRASFELAEGRYFVAALREGQRLPLTPEFALRALADRPPEVQLEFPGADRTASPIEEIAARVAAQDDFHLESLRIEYSINGGPWRTRRLPAGRAERRVEHLFALEDLRVPDGPAGQADASQQAAAERPLRPGDVISYFAAAGDHTASARSDLYFIEVQPFERRYQQSQQSPQGGGQGGEQSPEDISARQRQILVSTWNLLRQRSAGGSKSRGTPELRERVELLARLQQTLREQAKTLVERARARALGGAGQEIALYIENFEQAGAAMEEAHEALAGHKLDAALPPEQRALGHLLRAEASLRDVQVGQQQQGGGQPGGDSGRRQLAELFELEMDPAKNRYELPSQSNAGNPDAPSEERDAFERLAELARRQERLAEQLEQRKSPPTLAERWQQEQLRRELEELRRQLERREAQQRQQSAQNGQPQSGEPQSGQSRSGEPQGEQDAEGAQQGSQQGGSRSRQLSERLSRAERSLEEASRALESASAGGEPSADAARRAQQASRRLGELVRSLSEEQRSQQREALSALSRRSAELSERQRRSAQELERAVERASENGGRASGLLPDEERALSEEKGALRAALDELEREATAVAGEADSSQPEISAALRGALRELREAEVAERLSFAQELIREGSAPFALAGEDFVTDRLEELRERMRSAEQRQASGGQDVAAAPDAAALASELARLRQRLESDPQGPASEPRQGRSDQPQGQAPQGQQPGAQSAPQGGRGDAGGAPGAGAPRGPETPEQRELAFGEVAARARALGNALERAGLDPATLRRLLEASRRMRSARGSARAQSELALRLGLEDAELALREQAERASRGGALRPAAERLSHDAGSGDVAEYYRSLSSASSRTPQGRAPAAERSPR